MSRVRALANRVTDEGLYKDGNYGLARPLTTAYGGASPQGEALIGCDVISSVSREIPRGRNGTTRTRASQMPAVAHRREIPRGRNGTTRTRASQMPSVAHRREIPRGRNENDRTRGYTKHSPVAAFCLARAGSAVIKPSPLGEGGTECRMRGRLNDKATVNEQSQTLARGGSPPHQRFFVG